SRPTPSSTSTCPTCRGARCAASRSRAWATAIAPSPACSRRTRAGASGGGSARPAPSWTPAPAPTSTPCVPGTSRSPRSRSTSRATRRWSRWRAGSAGSSRRCAMPPRAPRHDGADAAAARGDRRRHDLAARARPPDRAAAPGRWRASGDPRRARAQRDPHGAAPPVRGRGLRHPRLRGHRAADRPRPDHFPTLGGGAHDRGVVRGRSAAEEGAGGGHRFRLPGRHPGGAGAAGVHRRAHRRPAAAGAQAFPPARPGRAQPPRRRPPRRARGGAVRRDRGHRRGAGTGRGAVGAAGAGRHPGGAGGRRGRAVAAAPAQGRRGQHRPRRSRPGHLRSLAVGPRRLMKLFQPMYERALVWAAHRSAPRFLGFLSFVEAIIFPVMPEVMLAPMTLAQPLRWFRYATISLLGSLAGALVGYALGYFAYEAIKPLLASLGWIEKIDEQVVYLRGVAAESPWKAFWILVLAGFAPIPLKLFTWASGIVGVPLVPFMA